MRQEMSSVKLTLTLPDHIYVQFTLLNKLVLQQMNIFKRMKDSSVVLQSYTLS